MTTLKNSHILLEVMSNLPAEFTSYPKLCSTSKQSSPRQPGSMISLKGMKKTKAHMWKAWIHEAGIQCGMDQWCASLLIFPWITWQVMALSGIQVRARRQLPLVEKCIHEDYTIDWLEEVYHISALSLVHELSDVQWCINVCPISCCRLFPLNQSSQCGEAMEREGCRALRLSAVF